MKAIAGIALAISIAAGLDTPREETRRRSEEAQIVHVLNRIAFGPRPTDIDAVRTMGVRPLGVGNTPSIIYFRPWGDVMLFVTGKSRAT